MQALKERRSTKSFKSDPIPMEILSNLLWAGYGINRPDSGKRTAPSALNSQNIDIYVCMDKGVYLYEAKTHSLKLTLKEDIRNLIAGPQDYPRNAPIHLLYVADLSKLARIPNAQERLVFSACNMAMICQNVELFCASSGLGAVTRGTMDIPSLREKLKLKEDQVLILNQIIGYAKE
ncbi:MAG: SagB/ThcOx family dehydrogenase [Deltaproteobacteria bacterium]|nr:SagB/ThcOx family dehydrogenase [Deltaproteobacteria bacterium]